MVFAGQFSRRALLGQAAGAAAAFVASSAVARAAPSASEPSWQVGVYTRPWAKYDYRTAFDAIAAAGYRYVGLMTAKGKGNLVLSMESTHSEAHAVGEEAKKRGLRIVSVYGGGFPVLNDSLEKGVEGLKRLIDHVATADGRSLLLGGLGDPKLQEPYYKTIAACCDYAADKKIMMAIKPHGGQNATGPQCRKWIEMVGHKSFRLWYDPGNVFFYSDGKLDPVDDAATVNGLVVGMSVKDYQHPKRVDVTPGTGQVRFPAVMERLKKGGFTSGPLVIETLAPGDEKTLIQEAQNARKFVEGLL